MRLAQSHTVSLAEIETFARDGVVCLRGVLPSEAITQLGAALDEMSGRLGESVNGYDVTQLRRYVFDPANATYGSSAQQHDIEGIAALVRAADAAPLLDTVVGTEGHFLLDTTTWRRNRSIRELALDSCLPDIARQLLSTCKVNYADDQMFVKQANTADRTAFHQDHTYFRMRGFQGCVMWIPADRADAQSGALFYARGSHLWDREFLPNVFMAQVSLPGGEGESLDDIETHPDKFDLVQFDVAPGDVVVHHFRTVHGAGGNRSGHPRRALSLRYCGDDMRYFDRPGAPAQPYQTHQLRDGDPLDSVAFPVVYPRPFPGFLLADCIPELHEREPREGR